MKIRTPSSAGSRTALGAAIVALTFGCGEPAEQQSAPSTIEAAPAATAPAIATPAETAATVMRLPVSLNTVMVAMVNQAADPLWVAAWRSPESDADWRELERRAVQLELGGTLLSVPGTGPLDDNWTSNPVWQKWSLQLSNVGADAVAAVKARNTAEIAQVGDRIVEICEGCHIDFKLALPTGGEFGELSPTADDFNSE